MTSAGPLDAAQDLAERAAAVAAVDPVTVASEPEAQLADEIAALYEAQAAIDAALATRLGPFDKRGGYAFDGAASVAQWAGRECGADPRVEASRVKVAHKLTRCDRVRDAVVEGKLSPARARILVRYLTVSAPRTAEEQRIEDAFHQAEATFVDLARELTVRQCERLIRRWYLELAPEDAEARWNEQWTKRHLYLSRGLDGTGILDGILDAESHAIFRQALEDAYERLWRDDVAAAKAAGDKDLRRSPAQRWVDALTEVSLGYLAVQNLPDDNGRARPAVPSVVVDIELDPATLEPACGSIGGTAVPKEVLGRILCEGRLARLLCTPASVPLDMGYAADLATPHQRKAIARRDGGCAFPGCDRPPRWCNVHHCTHREHDGRTDLDNLVMVCRHHHRLMHEGGWRCWIDDRDGRPRFRHPDGRILHPDSPDPRPPRPPERSTDRDAVRPPRPR